LKPLRLAQLRGHCEVHDVAGAVLDDVLHARAARAGEPLRSGRGVGEENAWPGQAASSIPRPANPLLHRFVAAAATRQDPGFAGGRRHVEVRWG